MSKRSRSDEEDTPDTTPTSADTAHPPDTANPAIACDTPPCHGLRFSSYAAYEAHVLSNHFHTCSQCKKRFPNETILEIHLEENHSAFFALKQEQAGGTGKIFRCFEHDCNKLTADRRKRRLHLVDKHGYPKNYRFNIVDTGIGDFHSLLR